MKNSDVFWKPFTKIGRMQCWWRTNWRTDWL